MNNRNTLETVKRIMAIPVNSTIMAIILARSIESSIKNVPKHDIQVVAIFLEDYMGLGKFRTSTPKADIFVVSVADNIAVQDNVRVI